MSFFVETGDVLEADDLAASKRQSDIAGEYRLQRVPLKKRQQQMSVVSEKISLGSPGFSEFLWRSVCSKCPDF